jgi:hypothetical protein
MDVSSQLHVPAALVPGKEPPHPLDSRAVWAQLAVWTMWRRDEYLAYAENRTLTVQLVSSANTELYRFWFVSVFLIVLTINSDCFPKRH